MAFTKLPNRSAKYGIGKDIGGAVYLHRTYEELLGKSLTTAKAHLPPEFDYQVVKYNYQNNRFSFIQCVDFDTAEEPTVGDMMTVDSKNVVHFREQQDNPELYHHKWLFVGDDYDGFDVEKSKERSLAWMSLSNINRRRIGRKDYWENEILPLLEDMKH